MIRSLIRAVQWFPPLFTRLVIGFIFLQSGYGKLTHLNNTIHFFSELKIPFPQYQAPFVAVVELLGGALIVVGALTRWASLPLIATMIVALLTAKADDIHEISDLLMSSEFLLICLLTWLVISGPGPVSVDHFARK